MAFCGEHEDRDGVGPRVPLHLLENGVTIEAGRHEVENDEVWLAVENQFQSFPAIVDHFDTVTGAFEVEGNQGGDVHFVFDDQNLL